MNSEETAVFAAAYRSRLGIAPCTANENIILEYLATHQRAITLHDVTGVMDLLVDSLAPRTDKPVIQEVEPVARQVVEPSYQEKLATLKKQLKSKDAAVREAAERELRELAHAEGASAKYRPSPSNQTSEERRRLRNAFNN